MDLAACLDRRAAARFSVGDGTKKRKDLADLVIIAARPKKVLVMGRMHDLHSEHWEKEALRANHELCRKGLQAQPAHIAVINSGGRIVLVNEAWAEFARANGSAIDPNVTVGANYLDICRKAATDGASAKQALTGIEAVLSGKLTQFSVEYPCASPTEERWFLMTVAPLDLDGHTGAIISHLNITEGKEAQRALRASDERFHAIFENAAVGIAEVSADGRWLRVNDALARLTGYPVEELLNKTIQEVTHPHDRDADAAHIEVLRSGATNSFCLDKRFLREDGSDIWVGCTLSVVRAADGAISYFVAVIEDISERKLAEQRQQTLMHELSHRGKNLLAIIQSIANRSLSGAGSLDAAKTAFIGRLTSLSKTYDSLTAEAFDGALLDVVLANELASFGVRAQLKGPSVILTVKAAQTFALAAHELMTNAAKYGALSVAGGRLHVSWNVEDAGDERRFQFNWREEGGPKVVAPTRQGFGSTLISRVLGAEFKCAPKLDYSEEGFSYCFEAPLARLGDLQFDLPVRRKLKSEIVCSLYNTWARQRGGGGVLPSLDGFEWSRFAATGALTIASIDESAAVHFVQVGRALIEQLGRPLEDRDLASEDPISLAEAYRRCARMGKPCHEYLRFDFGDGDPLTFERLLVPFSAKARRDVTHVVGVVVYRGDTRPPERKSAK